MLSQIKKDLRLCAAIYTARTCSYKLADLLHSHSYTVVRQGIKRGLKWLIRPIELTVCYKNMLFLIFLEIVYKPIDSTINLT